MNTKFTFEIIQRASGETGIPAEEMCAVLGMETPDTLEIRKKVDAAKTFEDMQRLITAAYPGSLLAQEIERKLVVMFDKKLREIEDKDELLDLYRKYHDDTKLAMSVDLQVDAFFMRKLRAADSLTDVATVYHEVPSGSSVEKEALAKLRIKLEEAYELAQNSDDLSRLVQEIPPVEEKLFRLAELKLNEVLIAELAKVSDKDIQGIVDIYHKASPNSPAKVEAIHRLLIIYHELDEALLISSLRASA